jgi:hypothetical protein
MNTWLIVHRSYFIVSTFFSTLRRVFAGSEGRHHSAGGSLNFRWFCYSSPSSLYSA